MEYWLLLRVYIKAHPMATAFYGSMGAHSDDDNDDDDDDADDLDEDEELEIELNRMAYGASKSPESHEDDF